MESTTENILGVLFKCLRGGRSLIGGCLGAGFHCSCIGPSISLEKYINILIQCWFELSTKKWSPISAFGSWLSNTLVTCKLVDLSIPNLYWIYCLFQSDDRFYFYWKRKEEAFGQNSISREESSQSAIKLVIYVGSDKLYAIFTPSKQVGNFCLYASSNVRWKIGWYYIS